MSAYGRNRKHRKTSWENKNAPECEGYGRYFIVGKPRAGKTTLAVEMAIRHLSRTTNDPRYPRFDRMIIVSPSAATDPSMSKLWDFLQHHKIPTKLYKKFNKESAHKDMMETLKANAALGLKTILFIDDQLGNSTFTKRADVDSWYNNLVSDLKTYLTEMLYLTQVITGMAATARKNQEVFIFFSDLTQRDDMWKCCQFVDNYGFNQLMDEYANERGRAIWINAQYGNLGVFRRDERGALYAVTDIPV